MNSPMVISNTQDNYNFSSPQYNSIINSLIENIIIDSYSLPNNDFIMPNQYIQTVDALSSYYDTDPEMPHLIDCDDNSLYDSMSDDSYDSDDSIYDSDDPSYSISSLFSSTCSCAPSP